MYLYRVMNRMPLAYVGIIDYLKQIKWNISKSIFVYQFAISL
jgi:hypothetical protein